MDADLDLLCISVYCTADDLLPQRPGNGRRRLSDAEIVTLCVAQVLMGSRATAASCAPPAASSDSLQVRLVSMTASRKSRTPTRRAAARTRAMTQLVARRASRRNTRTGSSPARRATSTLTERQPQCSTTTCPTGAARGSPQGNSRMTDEPTCTSDCEPLALLASLFCVECDVNTNLPVKGSTYG
jgi:hypothetical protein